MNNSRLKDCNAKVVLENPKLCLQLLQDYLGLDIFKNVKVENIEDVTERFLPMFTEERDADVIKKIKIDDTDISQNREVYVVSLIEHKASVDYNVVMQLLRYMVYIWEDFEKEQEKRNPGITRHKDFLYPPILPIVYYEGHNKWTACTSLRDRIAFENVFGDFIPNYKYELVSINSYTDMELIEKKNELSLVMLINKTQNAEDLKNLNLPKEYLEYISKNSSQEILKIISIIIAAIMRKYNMTQQEIDDFTDLVRERRMGELFENFTGAFDIQKTRAKAMKEGYAEGRAEGREEGYAEGEDVLLEVILKIKNGASRQELLAEGYLEDTINKAEKALA